MFEKKFEQKEKFEKMFEQKISKKSSKKSSNKILQKKRSKNLWKKKFGKSSKIFSLGSKFSYIIFSIVQLFLSFVPDFIVFELFLLF